MQLRCCQPEHRRFPPTRSHARAEMRPGLARARQGIAPQGLERTLGQSAWRQGLPDCIPACLAGEVVASNRVSLESGPRQGVFPENAILGQTGDPMRSQPNLHSIWMAISRRNSPGSLAQSDQSPQNRKLGRCRTGASASAVGTSGQPGNLWHAREVEGDWKVGLRPTTNQPARPAWRPQSA